MSDSTTPEDSTESKDASGAQAYPVPNGESSSGGNWIFAILISTLLAWGFYTFPPVSWRVPDRLADVSALSPQAEQDELAAVEKDILWKNSLFKFGAAGLFMGIVGFLYYGKSAASHIVACAIPLLVGVAAGLLAAVLGLWLRGYLDVGRPIPLISEQSRPLFCDALVLSFVSLILLCPLSVLLCMQPQKQEKQKAFAVPLGGIVAGALTPVIASLALPQVATNSYPPYSIGLTVIWFLLLGGLSVLFVTMLGNKPKAEDVASE